MTSKDNTRKFVLKQRDLLGISTREQKSRQICDQLIDVVNRSIGSANGVTTALQIAAYEPMRSEVDVHPILRFAYERNWLVYLPCMAKDSESSPARMVFFQLDEQQVFANRPEFLDHPARPTCCQTCMITAGVKSTRTCSMLPLSPWLPSTTRL